MACIRGGQVGGGEVGGGGGWAAEGGLRVSLKHKQSCCVFSRQHKQFQSIGQAKTVVGYSLEPHTPLLMQFSGSTGYEVHLHGLTGSRKVTRESRLGHLYPYA